MEQEGTELKFEEALKKLESIVQQLENEELELENSLQIYEEGVRLSRWCNRKLEEVERKVEILSQNGLSKEDFPEEQIEEES